MIIEPLTVMIATFLITCTYYIGKFRGTKETLDDLENKGILVKKDGKYKGRSYE